MKLFTWFGIPVKVHWSFGLLIVWVVYSAMLQGMDWSSTGIYLLLVLSLFVCVVLHEFGHALTAKRYGIHTEDITLYPIGGVARLMDIPERPLHELLIAVAGPLVNVLIAIVLFLLVLLAGMGGSWMQALPETESTLHFSAFLPLLIVMNLFLVVFNMIPAFPMDGGRVLRSLLAMRFTRLSATRIAAISGQVIAAGFFLYGLYSNQFNLTLIGLFVFFAASSELRAAQIDERLRRYQVGDIMKTDFTPLLTGDPVYKAVELLQSGREAGFLVFGPAGDLVGCLHEGQVIQALQENRLHEAIDGWVKPVPEAISITDPIKTAYTRFAKNPGISILPVTADGRILGILDVRRINLLIRANQTDPQKALSNF